MLNRTRREVAAFLLTCGAWALIGQLVAHAAEESPLSAEMIVEKKFEDKTTVQFSVGKVYLMPSSWTTAAIKSAPLRIVPKAAGDNSQVSVIVSRETANRLKRLGIENPDEHFRGKVLRVSGTVERLSGSSGPEYRIQVTSLDQLEAIRKP
jgi:hypothetical protein